MNSSSNLGTIITISPTTGVATETNAAMVGPAPSAIADEIGAVFDATPRAKEGLLGTETACLTKYE
jgi:hypothetical protein